MTRMLVLAGGRGTRLKSAVPDVPKALAPVNGAPFLDYQIHNWTLGGVQNLTFLLHHGADQIISYLSKLETSLVRSCTISWVTEPEPLDTGGAIANAINELSLDSPFLVANADTWIEHGVARMATAEVPTLSVIKQQDASRYGKVELDQNSQITAFFEKSQGVSAGFISAGLSLLDASVFEHWNGKPLSLERTVFPALAEENRLKGRELMGGFIDIGVPEDYFHFCRDLAPNIRKGNA